MARTKLIRTAAVALTVGAISITGCGVSGTGSGTAAGGTKPQPVEAGSFEGAGGASFLKQAASSTAKVTSLRQRMTITTKGSGLDFELTADGEFDVSTGRGRLTMSMPEMAMGGDIEMVVDGDTIYMKIPMLADEGKPWAKLDAKDLGASGGAGSTGAAGDPGAFLKMLEGTGAEITTLGKEDVRGTSTTHIATTLDLRELVEQAAGKEKADLQEKLDGLGGGALPNVPAEAWIDDDGYVRKMTMDLDLGEVSGASGTVAGTVSVMVELYDFNEPVQVDTPDPSQVGDLGAGLFGGN